MKKLLVYLLLITTSSIAALDLNLPLSSELNASSGLFLIATSPLAVIINPSLFSPGLASSITRLYNLPDLSIYSGAICLGKGNFGCAIGGKMLSHPLWQEMKISGALSYQYRFFRLGFAVNYLSNNVEDYHSGQQITYDLGMMISDSLFATTILVKNLSQTRFLEEELPVYLVGEYSHSLHKYCTLAIGFEKEREQDFSIKIGNRSSIIPMLDLICSYQFQPDRISGGIIIHYRKFHLSFSVRTHRYLDLSESISINYEMF